MKFTYECTDEREVISMKKIIKRKGNYMLLYPANAWDMNYHLLDDNKKIEYLISIDDITDDENDEDGGLYIKTLLNLEDIDEILSYAWKETNYISDSYTNLLNGTKKTIAMASRVGRQHINLVGRFISMPKADHSHGRTS